MLAIRTAPDLQTRIDQLGTEARFEIGSTDESPCARGHAQQGAVYRAACGGGRTVPLLKTLLTSHCTRGCGYCAIRAPRGVRRTAATPDEMAAAFDEMLRRGIVRGIFLSSGIHPDGVTAMDRLLDTAALLRGRIGFHGYLHLKVLPGAQEAQVEEAARLASRISLNLEAPSRQRLRTLAPGKCRPALLRSQVDTLARLERRGRAPASGWTTQFVVGPAGESDAELLHLSQTLYRTRGLRRAYYARFEPVPDTPLQRETETPLVRQHRIYQADHLLRFYGFGAGELPFDDNGRLETARDPKTAWARRHPERFPVEVNGAEPMDLLRVPGLGPVTVRRIVRARRQGAIDDEAKLEALGVSTRACAGFVTLAGKLLPSQLSLFD